jgi:uncharacterized surface protein with fasciclin (FAS1) repeats
MKDKGLLKIFMWVFAICIFTVIIVYLNVHSSRVHKSTGLEGKGVIEKSAIIDYISHKNKFSNFAFALRLAGITPKLSHPGFYTVFDPTNKAFKALPQDTFNTLMQASHKQRLVQILKYHILSGALKKPRLMQTDSLKTLEGENIYITHKNGQLFVNGVKVEAHNIKLSNGVVYTINRLLIPGNE